MRHFLAIGVSSALILQATAVWAAPAASRETRAAGAQALVTIEGKTQIGRGQALPEFVQLRSLETGQLVATTTCNSQGNFSFDHRRPGRYTVELVNPAGAIVGSSAAIAAPARAAVPVTVAATMPASRNPATVAAGVAAPTASVVTTTAAAAGISGVAVAGRHHPSPSF